MSGAVDAAIVSPKERYAALDQGMKDIVFIGKRVKNSWGTICTSDRFIDEQPKLMAGFTKGILKALDYGRSDREGMIAAATKFTELDGALVTRLYDDLIGSFTKSGWVGEQTQKNNVTDVNEVVPSRRAYDFSFVRQA